MKKPAQLQIVRAVPWLKASLCLASKTEQNFSPRDSFSAIFYILRRGTGQQNSALRSHGIKYVDGLSYSGPKLSGGAYDAGFSCVTYCEIRSFNLQLQVFEQVFFERFFHPCSDIFSVHF